MHETLETIAASIRELRQSMDSRFNEVAAEFGKVDSRFNEVAAEFGKVDSRFDEVAAAFGKADWRFEELKAQLRTDIESVRGDVRLVAEAFGSQAAINERTGSAHSEFKKRFDDHDTRLVALERKSPGQTSA